MKLQTQELSRANWRRNYRWGHRWRALPRNSKGVLRRLDTEEADRLIAEGPFCKEPRWLIKIWAGLRRLIRQRSNR